MNKTRIVTLGLILFIMLLGGCSPSETSIREPELPPPPQPAFYTEEGAINAVILYLADLTGFVEDDYAFICNQLRDIYDWNASRTQDLWSVSASSYVQGIGKQHIGTWRIDGQGKVTPYDAKAQEQERGLRQM